MLVFHVKLGSERRAQSTGAGWGAGGDMLLEPWALEERTGTLAVGAAPTASGIILTVMLFC